MIQSLITYIKSLYQPETINIKKREYLVTLNSSEIFWIWKTVRSAHTCDGMDQIETEEFQAKIKMYRNIYLSSIGAKLDI